MEVNPVRRSQSSVREITGLIIDAGISVASVNARIAIRKNGAKA